MPLPTPAPGLLDIVNIAGKNCEIYSYLQPQELCRLSLCNRVLHRNVESVRYKVLQSHLPIQLVDDTTKDTICLSEGHTYTDKAKMQDFMVHKFDAAGILVKETYTREKSMERARYLFRYQNWCHLTLPEHTFHALAECHIDEIDPDYANRMIGWNDCKGVMEQNLQAHQFAMNWVRYLLSDTDVIAKRWNWVSNHPNFRQQSVRGTGIMLTTPNTGENIEIRWDKKFKLVGSIFDSNLHRRRRIE
mmetsp:Transcript_21225/g.46049  ORF Transcript_21225/g.46049 Transcript_21225/m.46049 type:complete len:246 (+) Transcript_21225:68-805(+)